VVDGFSSPFMSALAVSCSTRDGGSLRGSRKLRALRNEGWVST
jgi:hypothetical protein